jgi:hypothetical protein
MLVMFECTVVMQRQRNLRELRSLQTPKQRLHVYRGGKWEVRAGAAWYSYKAAQPDNSTARRQYISCMAEIVGSASLLSFSSEDRPPLWRTSTAF